MLRALCLACLLAFLCLSLDGCGNKGALVMPDQATKQKHHKSKPATPPTSSDQSTGTSR